MRTTTIRRVQTALWIAAMLSFFLVAGLSVYYDQTRPEQADIGTGRVRQLNQHGHFVYVGAREAGLIDGAQGAFFVCIVATLVLECVVRGRRAESE